MRKLVWCGAAVMVAGAAAVYMTASHAAKNPDSYWGRCFNVAAHLGIRSNPFVLLNNAACQSAAAAAAHRHGGLACGAVAGQCAEDEVVTHVHKPADVVEGHCAAHEAADACEPVAQPEPADAGEMVEAEAVAPWEPIRVEVVGCRDEPRAAAPVDVFNPALIINMPCPVETDEPAIAACVDVELLPAPAAEEECDAPCKCGLIRQMLKVAGLVHADAIEWEAIPMPAPCADAIEWEAISMPSPCADDEPQEEGVEESMPQANAVNPYPCHHQHCPYMGCPYSYSRATPVEPTKQAPVKKKVRTRKVKVIDGEPCVAPAKESFWKKFHDETPCSEGVDTMEFRPTDDYRAPPGSMPY
ncbi:MAG: hypothetical protein IT429_21695 [Gemmataceae bacterium]|nr:hypothetical protein [Gemmataceae bacterium]